MQALTKIFFSGQRKYYLILFAVALLTYWPLSFGIYSLKNDALIYFLPWRRQISESIQNGYFPFWSPYLFTGLPLHSEMPAGTWNPFVLLISLFTRYNMRILEAELVLYIFICGLGMFKLVIEIGNSARTAALCAVSYMCCGFITDSGSFISWINCAAWLPFAFLFFYRVLKAPSLISSIKWGLSLFLLFTTCDPSFLFFSSYIMLAAILSWFVKHRKDSDQLYAVIKYFTVGSIVFFILSSPALISYIEFFPYYSRGHGASLAQSLVDPFPPFSAISYLLPNAVVKKHGWLNTDIAMRNAYVGVFILIFFIKTLLSKMNPLNKFVLGATVFSFLFSLGDFTPVREWCYNFLPLLNSFRHPAIIRIFTTVGILVIAAPAIESYFNSSESKKIKMISRATIAVIAILFLNYIFTAGIHHKDNFVVTHNLKSIIDTISFEQIAVTESIIQIVFVFLFIKLLKNPKRVILICILNNIIFVCIALPFTFISQSKTADVNKSLTSFPLNYPMPDLHEPLHTNNYQADIGGIYAYKGFYSKKISIQNYIMSPTVNIDYLAFLNDSLLRIRLDNKPFAYIESANFTKEATDSLSLKKFTPVQFTFTSNVTRKDNWLYLFQQYNPNWKVYVNNEKQVVEKANTAFMRVKIPPGKSEINFKYTPGIFLSISMTFSFILLLTILAYIFKTRFKSSTH